MKASASGVRLGRVSARGPCGDIAKILLDLRVPGRDQWAGDRRSFSASDLPLRLSLAPANLQCNVTDRIHQRWGSSECESSDLSAVVLTRWSEGANAPIDTSA